MHESKLPFTFFWKVMFLSTSPLHWYLSLHPNLFQQCTKYGLPIRPAWIFGYKGTNATASLNLICAREITDNIWYTFLTSLGCGQWDSTITNQCRRIGAIPQGQRKPPHAKNYKCIYQESRNPLCNFTSVCWGKKLGYCPWLVRSSNKPQQKLLHPLSEQTFFGVNM